MHLAGRVQCCAALTDTHIHAAATHQSATMAVDLLTLYITRWVTDCACAGCLAAPLTDTRLLLRTNYGIGVPVGGRVRREMPHQVSAAAVGRHGGLADCMLNPVIQSSSPVSYRNQCKRSVMYLSRLDVSPCWHTATRRYLGLIVASQMACPDEKHLEEASPGTGVWLHLPT